MAQQSPTERVTAVERILGSVITRLQQEVKKAEEEWGRKLWMIVPPVAAVLVSNLLTILIMAYFKN